MMEMMMQQQQQQQQQHQGSSSSNADDTNKENNSMIDEKMLRMEINKLHVLQLRDALYYLAKYHPNYALDAVQYVKYPHQHDNQLQSSLLMVGKRRPGVDLDDNGIQPTLQQQHTINTTNTNTNTNTNNNEQSSSSNNKKKKKTLIVLCTKIPKNKAQAQNQDRSMKICKEFHIIPKIILVGSNDTTDDNESQELCTKLFNISGIKDRGYITYPQFFIRHDDDDDNDNDNIIVNNKNERRITFLGDFHTFEQLHADGTFPIHLLKQHTSSKLKNNNNNNNETTTTTTTTTGTPKHLENCNQPIDDHRSDGDSIGDIDDIFDPPKPPPSKTPLLDAAKKAAAARKQQEEEAAAASAAAQQQQQQQQQQKQLEQERLVEQQLERERQLEQEQLEQQRMIEEQQKQQQQLQGNKEVVTLKHVDQPHMMSVEATINEEQDEDNHNNMSSSTTTTKFPDGGACYLVYQPVDGELNIHYSEHPIVGAVGVWTYSDIATFKEVQGLGTSELIGNCATQVSNRKNYYSGWCQFIKAAKSLEATVTVVQDVGVPIDFYLYDNTLGKSYIADTIFDTTNIDAIACIPKNFPFDVNNLEGKKWTKEAKKIGAVTTFNKLRTTTRSKSRSRSPTRELLANTIENNNNTTTATTTTTTTTTTTNNNSPSGVEGVSHNKFFDQSLSSQKQQQPQQPPSPPKVPSTSPTNKTTTATTTTTTTPPQELTRPQPSSDTPACYLMYDSGSSGRLYLYYNKTPVENAIGRWTPGDGKKIAGFKFTQNLGRAELIGNCASGVQGRKNYMSGWNQFVRFAKLANGDVTLYDPKESIKGLPVDVWIYTSDNRPGYQTIKLQRNQPINVTTIQAVATLPKNTPFFENMCVDIVKWLADSSSIGASSRFESGGK